MGAKKGLIFGSRPCESWDFLAPCRGWPDLVIAADGGLLRAAEAGFSPDFYIGDGDSGGVPAPGLDCLVLPTRKDVTDLEAACQWAEEQGVTELLLTGCTGGRLDHHMAALGLLEGLCRRGVQAAVLDPRNRVEFLLPGCHPVKDLGYRYLSLIPADRVLEDVCITGMRYELSHRDVVRGQSLTVSNEFAAETGTISFSGGSCWLIRSSDG